MRTITELNDDELQLVNDYVELYGLETMEEALDIAIAEGVIDNGEGGRLSYLPDGFKQLKLFTGHQKAKESKVNKALKKAKKSPIFEEDNFYLGTVMPKDDSGEVILDDIETTDCGETPTIVVLQVKYKATRAAFDASGKPEDTNFDSTLVDNIYSSGQENMKTKYGNVLSIIKSLKEEYHDGKMGKTQANVPAALKVKFRVVLFCLVKTPAGWERAMLELSNRYEDSQNLVTEWNTRNTKLPNVRYRNKLVITGADNFDNPIIQIQLDGEFAMSEVKKVAPESLQAIKSIAGFMQSQQSHFTEDAEQTAPVATSTGISNSDDGDEEEVPDFSK